MLTKIQNLILTALDKLGNFKAQGLPKGIVRAYMAFVFLCVVLFLAAWLANWIHTGKADLAIFIDFMQTTTGAGFVGAILFMVQGNVDADNDGIPEKLVDEKRNDRPMMPPIRR